MATYAKAHPLRLILGIAVALAVLALGTYAAAAPVADAKSAEVIHRAALGDRPPTLRSTARWIPNGEPWPQSYRSAHHAVARGLGVPLITCQPWQVQ